ncbi:MAG TPA: VOC family protein [Streptosporangiaceae bacterium]|jgi:catechol 2,3-dioxygenase-like lactoylglutathione lyase family enzyme|nr:VOC family protein [Streptosporangiaceae bacterium]
MAMKGSADKLFTRLVPILVVGDLEAERRFYEALGMRVTYEGPEYPNFIALGGGGVEFGLERRKAGGVDVDPDRVLTWQLGVSDIDAAAQRCHDAGLEFTIQAHEPRPGWRYRTLRLRSPDGFEVLLEGPAE